MAYLQVDDNLKLVGAGGQLEQYGPDAVRFGGPAVEQALFLKGLLPLDGSQYHLPLVELANGRAADLHFHADVGTVGVLLLGVTADCDAARRVQQKAYEMTLLGENEKLLNRRTRRRVYAQRHSPPSDSVQHPLTLETELTSDAGR